MAHHARSVAAPQYGARSVIARIRLCESRGAGAEPAGPTNLEMKNEECKMKKLRVARTVKSWSQQVATLPYPVRLRGAPPLFGL